MMPKIGPTRTIKELQASARHTFHGKGRRGLPGVKTDSKVVDRNAHAQNGELGKRISNAVHALKKADRNGPLFVLGWRLYPNKENPHWSGPTHSCGCGCGCSSVKNHPGRRRK